VTLFALLFFALSGVQLESPLAVAALRCFSALTRLDLTRCRITAAGIASVAAAAAAPGLCVLSLAENAGLQSYTELQPLQQLSRLTRLDLSSPAAAMRLPGCQHTAVCQLTQLRHLALNCVIRTNRCVQLVASWELASLLVLIRILVRWCDCCHGCQLSLKLLGSNHRFVSCCTAVHISAVLCCQFTIGIIGLRLGCSIALCRNEDLRFLGEAHPEESLHNILSMQ
jgi:hypothetical protein